MLFGRLQRIPDEPAGFRSAASSFSARTRLARVTSCFVRLLLFRTIHHVALMMDRERIGREASPTAAVIDSQTVKAPAAHARGYDANKKIVGRKRHIAVDTDGRLLMVNLTTADIADSTGAQAILDAIGKRWPWIKHLFAEGTYDRTKLLDKPAFLDFVVEIVCRI
jgi:hypothetical protein